MHAITVTAPGGPEVLRWEEVPDPVPGSGEVLIRVAASAVNRADLLQRQGLYPPPPGASPLLGLECSGAIAALGDGVTGWTAGQPVCALLAGGGYAELAVAPVGQLLPVPTGVPPEDAAGLPEVACTVWSNLIDAGGLAAGHRLLVHGGASGIGTLAIQTGVALGARVAVTVGSDEKASLCRALGAELAVNYREQDFVSAVEDAFGGADLILDNMGAAYLERNLNALAPDGRLMVIGLQGGARAELDLGALLRRRGAVFALALRSRSAADKARIVAGVRGDLWPLIESGRIRTTTSRRFPLRDAAAAHRHLESGANTGKVILTVAQ